MTDLHAEHRPYLAAIADGEMELVPPETARHIEGCDQCRAEVDAHRLLGQRLRAAARVAEPAPAAAWNRRLILPLAAAAAVAVVVAGAVFTARPPVADQAVASAVLVAARQPQFHSSDPVGIARWCTAQYGNRVPVVALPGLVPQGARMDWPHGSGVATVTYLQGGEVVHVSWLSVAEGGSQPQVVTVGGRPAVLVRQHGITALVSGSESESQLVDVAREVAATL